MRRGQWMAWCAPPACLRRRYYMISISDRRVSEQLARNMDDASPHCAVAASATATAAIALSFDAVYSLLHGALIQELN